MTKFAILLNGDLTVTPRLLSQLNGGRIVAVDGGMGHAQKLGVVPECWIGDFDSSDPVLLEKWGDVEKITYDEDKNLSDGAIAIEHCRQLGASEIILVAGHGGRSDMVVAHQLQLISLARCLIKCFMTSGDEETWPLIAECKVGGDTDFGQLEGATLSVAGFSKLTGLTITGVRWPLENQAVGVGSTLTLSNTITANAQVSVTDGYGVVIISQLKKGYVGVRL